jgi:hypothetical protein
MYADDSTLEAASETLDQVEQKLNSDMVNVIDW